MKFISILFFLIFFNKTFSQELTLVYPNQNFVTENSTINFLWNKSFNPQAQYKLQISSDITFSNIIIDSLSSSTSLILNLSSFSNMHLYWRVQNIYNNLLSTTYSFYIIDLNTFNNISIWLRSDTLTHNNNLVSHWTNIVNNNFNFQQNNNSRKPLLVNNSLNNYPAIYFGGGKQFIGNDNVLTTIGYEFYSVLEPTLPTTSLSLVTDQGIISTKGSELFFDPNRIISKLPPPYGGHTDVIQLNNVSTSIISRSVDFTNHTLNLRVNDLIDSTLSFTLNGLTTGTIDTSKKFTIGGQATVFNSSRTFKGNMYEIILINDTVFQTEQDRNIIPNYLHQKYAPYPNLGQDIIYTNYGFCNTPIQLNLNNSYSSYLWSDSNTTQTITIDTVGEYWVRTVDEFGYNLFDTIIIKGNYSKFKDTISICKGDTALLYKNIGEGYSFLWSTGSIDSLINVINSGMFNVTITDTFGCSIYDQVYVYVDSTEFNSTLGTDDTLCLNNTLSLLNLPVNINNFSYLWSTGSNNSSILLNTSGFKTIDVTVGFTENCFFKDTINLLIKNVITPNIDFIADTSCYKNSTTFISTSTPSGTDIINNYLWTFPNNTTGSEMINTDYTHNSENSFMVTLKIETDSYCSNSITKEVFVHKLPIPNFTNEIFCAAVSSELIDLSSFQNNDSIVYWSWKYNTNDINNLQNPTVVLSNQGVNNITLQVTDKYNCTDSITKQIEVFPELKAAYSYTNTCLGDSVIFLDETQSLSVVGWQWSFNAFESSTLQNPKFVYHSLGMQTISLTIENAIGCKSNITQNIEISPQPIASFQFDKACVNDNTLFFDNSTILSDTIVSFSWQIDTTTFNNDSVSYIFSEEDIYDITYQIETKNGCTDDTLYSITVNPLPNPSFTFTPNYGTAPLEVNFTNQTTDAAIFNWSFGDSNHSTEENPRHVFIENGIYNISLLAINEFECEATINQQIAVIPSDLDIELKNLDFEIIQNADNTISIKPSIWLTNVGTRAIGNTDLVLRLNNGTQLAQHWQGNLGLGEIIDYHFDSYFLVSDLDQSNYICIEAINVNDGTEINFANNKACKLLKGLIQFSEPYPNPANNFVNIDIVTKSKGNCNIMIVDLLGHTIASQQTLQLQKGYNQIQIKTKKYQTGKYLLKIQYLNEVYLKSFVIK